MEIFNCEQGNDIWHRLRAGCLTATKLQKIMVGKNLKDGSISSTTKKAMLELIYELIGGEFSYDENAPQLKNYLLEQGNFFEGIAKEKYQELTGNKVTEIGFIKKNEWLGISPDGVIFKDDKITKAVEIKCPLGNNSKNFYKYLFEDIVPEDYLWQIVHYFVVINDLQELDFIVYNPNFVNKDKQLYIKNITRNDIENEINKAKNRIIEFRKIWETKISELLK